MHAIKMACNLLIIRILGLGGLVGRSELYEQACIAVRVNLNPQPAERMPELYVDAMLIPLKHFCPERHKAPVLLASSALALVRR